MSPWPRWPRLRAWTRSTRSRTPRSSGRCSCASITQWRKALRAPRVKIRVDATVPGAEVFFNGKSVGATPLLLTNVVPGFHYIRVVKEGAGAFGARVEAKDDANEVTANLGGSGPAGGGLGPVANAVTANRVDDDAFAAAAAVGKAQGAEYVLFGGVTKGERGITVATFMVAVKDGKAGRLVDLEFDLDLLSASVESFKLVEEVGARVKTFGDTLPKGRQPDGGARPGRSRGRRRHHRGGRGPGHAGRQRRQGPRAGRPQPGQ